MAIASPSVGRSNRTKYSRHEQTSSRGTLTMHLRLQPENRVSTLSSSTRDDVCEGSDAVSTVDTTLAIPSWGTIRIWGPKREGKLSRIRKSGLLAILSVWGPKLWNFLAKRLSKRPEKDPNNWLKSPNFENTVLRETVVHASWLWGSDTLGGSNQGADESTLNLLECGSDEEREGLK